MLGIGQRSASEIVQRVIGRVVKERFSFFRPHSCEMKFVDMAFLQSVDFQSHTLMIGCEGDALDRGCGFVDFRAAVVALVNVGVGLDLI